MEVTAPRVRDRRVDEDGERCRFTSQILPPYMRRSPKVAEVAMPSNGAAHPAAARQLALPSALEACPRSAPRYSCRRPASGLSAS